MPRRPPSPWIAAAAPLVAAAAFVALTACGVSGLATAGPIERSPDVPPTTCAAAPTKAAVPIAYPEADSSSTCAAQGAARCPAPRTPTPIPSSTQPSAPTTSSTSARPAPATPRRIIPRTALPTAPPYVRPIADATAPTGPAGRSC